MPTPLASASDIRNDLPVVDTSIDPTQFASGGVTAPDVAALDPPTDIDAATIDDYTSYNAQQGVVAPEATVESRMDGLLSKNSDYMKRATTRADQMSNRRGMLNSGMAVGAAHGAAIDAALPIAQQDAATQLQMDLTNLGYSNDEARIMSEQSVQRSNLKAGLEQDTNQFNSAQNFEADARNQDAQNAANMAAAAEANRNNFAILSADLQGQLAGIDNELAMNMEELASTYDIYQNLDTINGAIYQQLVAEIGTILANSKKAGEAQGKINSLIASAGVEFEFSTGSGSTTGYGSAGGGPSTISDSDVRPPRPSEYHYWDEKDWEWKRPKKRNPEFGQRGGGEGEGGGGGGGGGPGSGGGGVSCFIAGTKVLRGDGTECNIEDVELDDELLGMDGSVNRVKAFDRPLLWDRWLWTMNDEETPWFTSEHPFMTTDGWKALEPLKTAEEMPLLGATRMKEGDEIVQHDGSLKRLDKYACFEGDYNRQLYNFILDNTSTYFANGNLVHNVK